ncbi:amidase [Roseovarius pelagicus]|uniref:Amidase n=1 Tax=Roseovarius pelagicus TaxID=2980108 RepID=A0ABY6DBK3_9RHOB|nr:amidase [Roseovarius pelagicus]UXX82563.1 amidase [Roseovarius pelagicus]
MVISAFSSLTQLSEALAAGQTTSVEIVTSYLERIRRYDSTFGAFAEVYDTAALTAAEAADRLRAAGMVRGPLHGLPIAVKDLVEWTGHGCEFGSVSLKGRVSQETATILERLLAAGMIPIGRTEMVEFAFGGWGTNPLRGTPRNPYDLDEHRCPGGSSSGSGVAVAAGLSPAAIGSDTGGSVRIPATLTGIVGLKATYGRLSLAGCLSLSRTLDSIGPMTRTVADAAMLYHAMHGPDPRDPTTLIAPPSGADFNDIVVAGRRVAVMSPRSYPIGLTREVETAFEQSKQVLLSLGVNLVEIDLPFDFAELTDLNGRLIATEAYHVHRASIHDETALIGEFVRGRVLNGQATSATDYLTALDTHRAYVARYQEFMKPYDALLAPAAPFAAPSISEVDESAAPLAQFTRPANYLGACALALPVGTDSAGLPLGTQLMGRAYGEEMILAIGQAMEGAIGPALVPDLSRL